MSGNLDTVDTLPAMLAARRAATPDAVAYLEQHRQDAWQPVTWRAFADQVARLQRALCVSGLRHGDRLALIAPVSLRWECLHHAAMGMGVAVVGLDAHDLPERLAEMLALAEVAAIATTDRSTLAAVHRGQLSACTLLLHMGDGSADAGPHEAASTWLEWPEFEQRAQAVDVQALAQVSSTDTATIIFTSGTTGAPKGIAYSHGQVCLAVDAICDAFSFANSQSRLLCWLPLSNLFQRVVNLAAMRQGPCTYLLSDPRRVMDVVAEVAPDIFIGVPRFYEKLYAGLQQNLARQPWWARTLVGWAWQMGRRVCALERTGRRVPPVLAAVENLTDALVLGRVRMLMGRRLVCMVSGSAPMPLHLLTELQALGWPVLESYGMSENILPMATNRLDLYRLGSVGRPVAGNQIRIGADGGIFVKGAGVFKGYLGDAANDRLDAQGWFDTGDLGIFDTDGFLTLTGRSGDIIKTSTGRRVAPAGVEAVLRGVPGIDHAMLVGDSRKCLVAICTCLPSVPVEAASRLLQGRLSVALESLPGHDRPAAIGFLPQAFSVERGELTPNLKLRRDKIAGRHAALIERLYAAAEVGRSPSADILVFA
ncbi:MAG: AMP-binding protein [Aquabacterium sp.]|nr:AMP-binding protein [Aquabacterium sp.]